MSTRGSTVPDADAARRAASGELRRPPVSTDPRFAAVRRARAGRPSIVSAPDGTPAFWIVPFHLEGRTCGFARVELTPKVSQVATFGGDPTDRASWPEAEFFERPPAALVTEARARYPELRVQDARLSYDGNPAKWGWRIETGREDGSVVFVTPHGWYARVPALAPDPGREG